MKTLRVAQIEVEHEEERAVSPLEALDALRVAVTVYDPGERLVYANAHYNYLFRRFPPHRELLGRTYAELVALELAEGETAPQGSAEDYIAVRRAQLHSGNYAPFDLELADARVVEIKMRRTKDGGWIGLWTDATQARALAERTRQKLLVSEVEAQRQATYLADLTRRLDAVASEADAAKTTLLRTMSHELKTPLNAILGFADLMRVAAGRLTPEQVAEYSGLIHGAGVNLLRLINQILDLTKIAAGRFTLDRIALPAGALFRDALECYGATAREKNVSLALEDCGMDAVAHADEPAALTMMRNLVENAVNFTQPGGRIRLKAQRQGARVRMSVADNGPGVAAEDLQRITKPFEQSKRGMTDRPHGAGLGLPLVKALAELHGGRLELESALGEGFTATLELPAA